MLSIVIIKKSKRRSRKAGLQTAGYKNLKFLFVYLI